MIEVMAGDPAAALPPGFRFHPTDEELILHYLRNQAIGQPCPVSIIAEVDIYKCDPWDLPAKAMFGEQEWYFFSPRDRKYPNGVRPNRAAASGYWKATGTDKPIQSSRGNGHIGVKKALVFYKGKPPKGHKTSWIMHEYRLAETRPSHTYRPTKFSNTSMRLDDWVLCRIYKKHSHQEPTISPADREQERELIGHTPNFEIAGEHQSGSSLQLQKSLSVSDFLEGIGAAHGLFDTLPELIPNAGMNQQQLLLAEQPKQRSSRDQESSASVDAEIQFKDEFSVLNQRFFFDHQLLLNPYLGSH